MGHNNGIISTPINIQGDIGYILGVASGDVGTLCTSDAVNMWSLSKPVRHATPYQPQNWQAAWNGNYGIAPYRLTGLNPLTSLYNYAHDGRKNGWVYEQPRGVDNNHNEWYRVLDFNGYNHASPRPWDGWTGVSSVLVGGNVWFGLDNVVNDWNGTPGSIYYGNILLGERITSKYLRDCYFGVAMFNSSGNCIGIITCQNKMGAAEPEYFDDANWSCGFDGISWPTGRYKAVPFFWISDTNAPMPSGWTTLQYGEIYTIPYISPMNIDVYSASSNVDIPANFAGIDADYGSTILIGISPFITITGSFSYILKRVIVTIKADGASGYETVYDTASDQNFVESSISGSGSSWPLVSDPTQGITGLTNCPGSIIRPKLPVGDNYTMTINATLLQNNSTVVIQKDCVIS